MNRTAVKCGIQINQGDTIYKKDSHWCKLETCANHDDLPTEAEKRQSKQLAKNAALAKTAGLTTPVNSELQQKLDENLKLMEFATKKTEVLCKITSQVTATLDLIDGAAPRPEKVGMFVKIIYDDWAKLQQQQEDQK